MRLIVSVVLLACAILSSATPIKQNEDSILMNRLVRASPSSKPRNARRGCSAYGHSCFGGYGKRDTPVPRGLPGSPGTGTGVGLGAGTGLGAPDAASEAAAAAAATLLDDAAYRLALDMHPSVKMDYPAYLMRQLMPASAGGRSPVWSSRTPSRHTGDWSQDLGVGEVASLRDEDVSEREGIYSGTGARLVGSLFPTAFQ